MCKSGIFYTRKRIYVGRRTTTHDWRGGGEYPLRAETLGNLWKQRKGGKEEEEEEEEEAGVQW